MKNLETILITGGGGFIGSNLCEFFIGKGLKVRCLDNFLTGNEKNLINLISNPNFELIKGDIRDYQTCLDVCEGVDAVSHQAALGSVPRSIENPIPTNEINAQGFLNMINAAKEKGIKRFVYASSSSVYGDSIKSPKMEDELGKPLSPYAVSKLTNELYGKNFFDLYGMETIGLRYFNVFGKNQDPNGAYAAAIPKFIQLFLDGKSPTVYGDGKQTRDFTYIKNVIHANYKALNTVNYEAYGQAFNVACGQSYSINNVLDVIKNNLEEARGIDLSVVKATYVDERKGDIKNSLANISKIIDRLNYSVQYSFEDGMKEYIDWYMQESR